MSCRPAHGRGIALVASMFVLMVVAALVAAAFFAALQEYRIGQNTVRVGRAAGAAEAGLAAALAGWSAAGMHRLQVGSAAPFAGTLPGGTGGYHGVVRRLNDQLFLLSSTGADASGSALETVAEVVRVAPIGLALGAAVTVAGPATISSAALVDGSSAPGPGCAAQADTVAGLRLADLRQLSLAGCAVGGCVRGRPAAEEDASLRGAAVPVLGESGWASLAAIAETVRGGSAPPGSLPGPGAPVVFAPGDLVVEGGAGVGLLLVQGDLVLTGGASLEGLVVVRGTLRIQGAGGTISGAVLAGGLDMAGPASGPVTIGYSTCGLRRALAEAGGVLPLAERGWVELF